MNLAISVIYYNGGSVPVPNDDLHAESTPILLTYTTCSIVMLAM